LFFTSPHPLGRLALIRSIFRCLSPPRIVEKVDRILVEVLPIVVVSHDCFRILVARHHLDLPICETLVECPSNGRPPEIVGDNFPTPE
jgi:hypothetical protein